MKNLFSIKNLATAVLALGFVFSFTSCEEDPCKDVTCAATGVATEVNASCSCVCDSGYEGTDCATLSRAKFIGTYTVSDACSASGSANYTVTIAASSTDETRVLIGNFWNSYAANVTATVDGNTLTIANQDPDSDGYPVQGTATYNTTANTITINYTVTETASGDNDVCQATFTKQ
jgi:hypothetical protein